MDGMRWLSGVGAVVASAFILMTAPARALYAADPPNILVLLADDVDGRDFGCYGNDAIRTPNIDALARGGLLFRNAFLTTAQCSPTRISVLTGKYPHATGAEDLHMNLPAGERFVPSYLKEKGYFTGHMRKTHYGPRGDAQFDWYSRELDRFGEFLDEAKDRPFFMWVGFRDAHRPYEEGAVDPPHDPAKVKVPPYLADTPETRRDLALYYDEISRMDERIGEFVATLKEREKFEDTLIVFFCDNGMPFPRAKGTVYDAGIRTALVFSWPRVIEAGSESEALASVIDLAPTFLDVAGIPEPDAMQGASMAEVLRDPSRSGRQYIFAERNWHNCDEHIRTVQNDRFKLIRNAYLELPFGHPADVGKSPSFKSLLRLKEEGRLTSGQEMIFAAPRPEFELYDLEADPWEFRNLAEESAMDAVLKELKGALERWGRETGDFPPSMRRREDNTNRITGVKFSQDIAPMTHLREVD